MFHRLQMKWSFCAASVVIAAKPVFHLTCRALVPPSGISVKFACLRAVATTTVNTHREFPSACFKRFLKAIAIELVADERALTVRLGSA
jgi:hypothetical protein